MAESINEVKSSDKYELYILRGKAYVTDKHKLISKTPVPEGAVDCFVDDMGEVHFKFGKWSSASTNVPRGQSW